MLSSFLPLGFLAGGLFSFHNIPMKIDDYILRLIACGYTYDRAYRTAHEIKEEFSMKDLNDFVVYLEKKNVGRV